jgi:hypothetical protein
MGKDSCKIPANKLSAEEKEEERLLDLASRKG